MTDKLKQFIEDNRAAFDSEEPSPRLFETMMKEKKNNTFGWTPLRWAAVFLGLILLSAGVYTVMSKKGDQQTGKENVVSVPVDMEIATGVNDPIYAKQIYHFQELIGLKQEELKQLKKDYPDLYKEFVGDLNQLDSAYHVLKTTLTNNPNREMLLEAMIENLQLQSDLLNRQLLIIKEIKQKSNSHENQRS
jgi:hypothetical protein